MHGKIIALPAAVFMLTAPIPEVIAGESELSMDDFAYGAELTPANTDFRRFSLTHAMINNIKRRDLGDIRVFDEDNELMPVIVRSTDSHIKTYRQPLSFTTHPQSYVLNRADSYKHWLKSLHLKWKPDAEPKILSIRVEHSPDQIEWKTLSDSEIVSNYQFSSTMIRHNAIDINDYTERYIRLVFLQRQHIPPVLDSVESYVTNEKPPELSWISSGNLEPVAGRAGSYAFSTSEGVSPLWLRLDFSELNSALSGSLYTVSSVDGRQQRKLITNNFSGYKVTLNNKVVRSRPISLSHIEASNWMIDVDVGNEIPASDLPAVMVAYPPYEVVFAADGDEPYTVVWGNASAGAPAVNDIAVSDDIITVRPGRILNSTVLAEQMKSHRFVRIATYIGLAVLIILALAGVTGYQRYQKKQVNQSGN